MTGNIQYFPQTGNHSTLTNLDADDHPQYLEVDELEVIQADTKSPSGFSDRTDVNVTFDNNTMTLSVAPAVTEFDFYVEGVAFNVTTTQTSTISNTEGLWFFFWNSSGVLTNTQSEPMSDTIRRYNGIVATLYWDSTNTQAIYFSGENALHEGNMSGTSAAWMHALTGLLWTSGAGLTTIDTSGNGSVDAHAQFGAAAGTFLNEDQPLTVSVVGPTAGIPIFYRDGVGGNWRTATVAGFSVRNVTTGNLRMAYNLNTAGTWSQAEVNTTDFALCHIFGSNDSINGHIISIQGQQMYNTINNARIGATTEVLSIINGGGLPFCDLTPLGSVIFQTSNGYANAVKSRIRDTEDGGDYVDFRGTSTGRSGVSSSHSQLAGLAADDHPQYATLLNRGGETLDIDVVQTDSIIEKTAGGTVINGITLDNDQLTFPNITNANKIIFKSGVGWTIGTQTDLVGSEIEYDTPALGNHAFRVANVLYAVVNNGGVETDVISELQASGNGVDIMGTNFGGNSITFANSQSITDTATKLEIAVLTGDDISMVVNSIEIAKFDNLGLNLPLETASRVLQLDASKNVSFVTSMSTYVAGGDNISTSDLDGVVTLSVDPTVHRIVEYGSNDITLSTNFTNSMSGLLVLSSGTITMTIDSAENLPTDWSCTFTSRSGTATITGSGVTITTKNGVSLSVGTNQLVHIQRVNAINSFIVW